MLFFISLLETKMCFKLGSGVVIEDFIRKDTDLCRSRY